MFDLQSCREDIRLAQEEIERVEPELRRSIVRGKTKARDKIGQQRHLELSTKYQYAVSLQNHARAALVGETGLFPIDPRHAMKSDDFERIMTADRLCVMPVRCDARHGHLDDFKVKGVIIAVGFIPELWDQESAPHFIPHAVAMMHQASGIIEKTNVAAFCMLHNLANMLTMTGAEVYYPTKDGSASKPMEIRTRLYSPVSPPDAFRIVTTAHGIKDHLGQEIMGDAAPGFPEHLKHKDQQKYDQLRSMIKGH